MKRWAWVQTVICGAILLGAAASASAQGLIWSLPEDGQWVRYEGTYTQTVRRPDSTAGDLNLEWRRNILIKSVGAEEAEYQGETRACRWIEIKTETGKTSEGVLDAGPGGVSMYKLLVPEMAIRGTVNEPVGNGRELFVSHIPVVKGYRRVGDEGAQEIPVGVFQVYPLVSLLRHYRELADSGATQSISVPAGEFECVEFKGQLVTETTSYRTTSSCEIFRSDAIPFGVVKWTAAAVTETKVTADERTAFTEDTVLKEELQAVSTGSGAESEFLVN